MGCWGGGGAIAVMEKRRGRAVAGEGYGGCYGAEVALLRAKEAGKTKKWALGVAGEHGRVKGAPWPRWEGRRRRAATLRATRRSAPETVGH